MPVPSPHTLASMGTFIHVLVLTHPSKRQISIESSPAKRTLLVAKKTSVVSQLEREIRIRESITEVEDALLRVHLPPSADDLTPWITGTASPLHANALPTPYKKNLSGTLHTSSSAAGFKLAARAAEQAHRSTDRLSLLQWSWSGSAMWADQRSTSSTNGRACIASDTESLPSQSMNLHSPIINLKCFNPPPLRRRSASQRQPEDNDSWEFTAFANAPPSYSAMTADLTLCADLDNEATFVPNVASEATLENENEWNENQERTLLVPNVALPAALAAPTIAALSDQLILPNVAAGATLEDPAEALQIDKVLLDGLFLPGVASPPCLEDLDGMAQRNEALPDALFLPGVASTPFLEDFDRATQRNEELPGGLFLPNIASAATLQDPTGTPQRNAVLPDALFPANVASPATLLDPTGIPQRNAVLPDRLFLPDVASPATLQDPTGTPQRNKVLPEGLLVSDVQSPSAQGNPQGAPQTTEIICDELVSEDENRHNASDEVVVSLECPGELIGAPSNAVNLVKGGDNGGAGSSATFWDEITIATTEDVTEPPVSAPSTPRFPGPSPPSVVPFYQLTPPPTPRPPRLPPFGHRLARRLLLAASCQGRCTAPNHVLYYVPRHRERDVIEDEPLPIRPMEDMMEDILRQIARERAGDLAFARMRAMEEARRMREDAALGWWGRFKRSVRRAVFCRERGRWEM
ncbi:hypothetical protein HDU93_002189 [Gonapodya sp. JEL0774]|nr:hypothetical protein HDU93_002189 [Gonapodya sp. JEL0774]